MDFIKGNEQVRIDPSGIDISGVGNIIIDSNSVTGDISFINDSFIINSTGEITINANNRVNFPSLNQFGQGVHSVNIMDGNIDIGEKNVPVDTKLFIHGHSDNSNPGSHVIYSKGGGFQTSDPYSEFIQRGFHFSSGAGSSPLFKFKLSDWDVNDNNIPSNEPGILVEGKGGENFFRVNQNGKIGIGTSDPSGCMLHLYNRTQHDDKAANIKQTTGTWTANGGTSIHNYAEFTDSNQSKTIGIQYEIHANVDYYGQGPTTAMLESKNHSKMHIISNNGGQGTEIYDDTKTAYNNVMTILSNGKVGIGTTNPGYPLHVTGSTTSNLEVGLTETTTNSKNYYYRTVNATGTLSSIPDEPATGGYTQKISIYASFGIYTAQILMASDSRIKTDISNIDDDRALQQVNALESKEYHYIDPQRKRPIKTIGFIAQEVKDIIPNAVSLQKEWIPDEMRIITDPQWTEDAGKYYLNIPDLDMSGAFTNKAKFYVSNDPSGNDEICKEVDIKEVPATSMNDFSTTNYVAEFDQSWNNVFFYGKQVTDFHTIDKAQIFALHHSAIQELDRKHEREVTDKNYKIQNLEGEVSNLTGQVASLTSRLESLEGAIVALQNN